ncbi:L,D-transpeptidase [Ruminiclostridium papyrosolvens DSM 2782]|nr:L,D-transpeptidase [Ruminiclostridium papyrosolvens]WES35078.1 L,D-transpeptidase [Ruminiclostridium papyrosolvens DSM 2782]
MIKKLLLIGTLMIAILFESTAVCGAADAKDKKQYPEVSQSAVKIDTTVLDKTLDTQKKQQEAQKKKEEAAAKEKLQKKIAQLQKSITANTYMNYIKQLGYYKKAYKNDEKLNIRNALLLFQSNHNMSVTGTYDTATKNMLVQRLSSNKFAYLDNVIKAPTKGRWIAVNKTTRVLTLYEGKKVLKKYAVAVGNPATLTKSGKYVVNCKLIDPDWGGGGFAKPVRGGTPQNPLGTRWMGINRTDGSYGIHGTNSFYSIGKYISHGCMRMSNYCVEELYPLVPMKAPVWVGTQTELKNWSITQPQFK